jgi:spermidine synthase
MQEPVRIGDSSAPDSGVRSQAGQLPMALLYSAALFLSALILFVIQPMFTKMILPLLGGTPAVWNTAVMFFQAMLLAGYVYAHLLSRLERVGWQVLIHTVVLAAGFLFLPIHLGWSQSPSAGTHPVAWLVALLTVSIGVPFFAVSATAPLLQRWFSRSGHIHASDPYFLYVASNIGGLLALLAYPVVIEPLFGLTVQSRAWTAGYALLAFTILLCAVSLRAKPRRWGCAASAPVSADTAASGLSDKITWTRRAHWVALSFVPSALLLAVTLHISTDVASAPFLWIAPLSLYMLSFIVVFARRPILRHKWMLVLQIPVYALLAIYFTEKEFLLVFPLHLAALFVTAMVCHGELVRRRPAASRLTEFYLWMSVGGLLGGVFCVLIAPAVFDSVLDYPLLLVFACLLRPESGGGWRRSLLDLALPAVFAVSYFFLQPYLDIWIPRVTAFFLPPRLDKWIAGVAAPVLIYLLVVLVLLLFRNRPVRFALGFAPLLFGSVLLDEIDNQLFRERSFFGVYTVAADASGRRHDLYHGNITHGDQYMDEESVRTPTSYYNREGPLGQVFDVMRDGRALRHVGCVGLGAGTTACYQAPGQTMTFFEVDPVMERIARDPALFRYLELYGRDVNVVIGDGRQSLSGSPDGSFDLISLDAFSSDAIPVHMLTREALAIYMRKLTPGGIVMFHISNRYVNLEPVLANLTADAGLSVLVEDYDPNSTESAAGASRSTWVAVARDRDDLASLEADDRWRPLEGDPAVGLWTDDYSNLFRTLVWDELLPWR